MSVLSVIGRCSCGVGHTIPVPDKSKVWTQKDFERVVCRPCGTTLENLKIEPVTHPEMKAAC